MVYILARCWSIGDDLQEQFTCTVSRTRMKMTQWPINRTFYELLKSIRSTETTKRMLKRGITWRFEISKKEAGRVCGLWWLWWWRKFVILNFGPKDPKVLHFTLWWRMTDDVRTVQHNGTQNAWMWVTQAPSRVLHCIFRFVLYTSHVSRIYSNFATRSNTNDVPMRETRTVKNFWLVFLACESRFSAWKAHFRFHLFWFLSRYLRI